MKVPLLPLGMLIVGVLYSLSCMICNEVRGGTPYGTSSVARPKGKLVDMPKDLTIAGPYGKRVAEIGDNTKASHSLTMVYNMCY